MGEIEGFKKEREEEKRKRWFLVFLSEGGT